MATTTQTAEAPKRGLPFPLSPSEGWTTVIFVVVLVLITVGSIQSLAWTSGSGILTSTAFAGMLLGFILAKQRRVPQWLADIPALTLGVLYAFYQTAQADESGHLGVLWRHLSLWVNSARSGATSNDDAIFLLFLAVLTMLLGYVSMWLIFRSRSPWLAAAANGVVLLINLNYASDDKTIYAVIFLLVALLLIVRFNLVERMRIWRSKGLRYPSELSWDFMQAGVIFIIVVVILAAAMPSNVSSGQLQDLWSGPQSPWQGVQNTFSRLFHINGGKSKLDRVGFGGDLTIQGSVNLPDIPVLTYTTNDLSNSYLQAVTYDHFDGHKWSQTKSTIKTFALSPNTLLAPETKIFSRVTATIHIIHAPDGNYIFGLAEPGSFSVPTIVHSDGIGLDAQDTVGSYIDWQVQPALKDGQVYQEVSYVSAATEDDLRNVPAPDARPDLYPPALLAEYTQLPDDLKNNPNNPVQATAFAWTQDKATMYDKLNNIIAHFTLDGFTYSSQNPEVPDNEDAAAFLLQQRSGYCTWYSTAMVMMARELGYPAREVEGFITGNQDPKTGVYTEMGTAAHAWVQVYFPGYGWINFEPSVSFSAHAFPRPFKNPAGTPNGPPSPPTKRPVPPVKKPTGTSTPQTPIVGPRGSGGGNVVVGAVTISLSTLIALILLAALSLTLWWRLLFRKFTPISRTFARMAVLGRLAGVRPRPAQTAAEYGAALSAQIPEQRDAIEAITELYVRERWAPDAPDPATLGDRWRAVRDRLVRRIARRAPRRR
jgi:hypothetical protein